MEYPNPRAELESLPVIRLRRSWRSVLPWMLAVFALGWAVLWQTAEHPETVVQLRLTNEITCPVPLLFLAWLALTIRPAMLMLDAHYEICHHHLRSATGILSLQKHSVEIAYEDLVTVEVEQSILDRILFIGDIIAGSAMTDAPRIVMRGIAFPAHYAAQIDHRVDLTRESARAVTTETLRPIGQCA